MPYHWLIWLICSFDCFRLHAHKWLLFSQGCWPVALTLQSPKVNTQYFQGSHFGPLYKMSVSVLVSNNSNSFNDLKQTRLRSTPNCGKLNTCSHGRVFWPYESDLGLQGKIWGGSRECLDCCHSGKDKTITLSSEVMHGSDRTNTSGPYKHSRKLQ